MTAVFALIYRAVEPMSTTKAAAAGGAGAGVSITAAMIDPAAISPWLHLLTLVIGSLTGLASFVLVALKLAQQWRNMRSQ